MAAVRFIMRAALAPSSPACAGLGDGVEDVQQIAGRPRKPITPRDHEHVAGLDGPEKLTQLLPVALRPADLLPIDFGAACRLQLGDLPARSWPFVLTRAYPMNAICPAPFSSRQRLTLGRCTARSVAARNGIR